MVLNAAILLLTVIRIRTLVPPAYPQGKIEKKILVLSAPRVQNLSGSFSFKVLQSVN